MKEPDRCENITDIRTEIDRLDRQVIAIISQRFGYVKGAAKFKTSETSVKAPEHFRLCYNNVVFGRKKKD